MKDIVVGARYAKSLVELAIERNQLDEVRRDMEVALQAIESNRVFKALLKNPVIPNSTKQQVLEGLFKNRNMNELSIAMIRVLVHKNREAFLGAIASEFVRMCRERNGIKLAEVTTTFALDDQMKSTFVNLIKNSTGAKSVELTEKIKPEIIGGYILKVDDKQIDESVRTKLKKLKNVISR